MELLNHLFVGYIILGEPLLSVLFYRRLCDQLARDPMARERAYAILLGWEWAWMVAVALLLVATPDPLEALGFQPPGVLGWGLPAGAALSFGITTLLVQFSPKAQSSMLQALQQVAPLLPSSRRERGYYAAVAVTAGICEEVLYRGYLMLYLSRYLPGVSPALIAASAGLIFGLGHAYQGWKGIVQTSIAGTAFGLVFWLTGSLIPSILLHALSDLRVLLVWKPAPEARAASH